MLSDFNLYQKCIFTTVDLSKNIGILKGKKEFLGRIHNEDFLNACAVCSVLEKTLP